MLRGLAAPETANNAACTGSFVPLLTLGIPGSGTTAVLLAMLLFEKCGIRVRKSETRVVCSEYVARVVAPWIELRSEGRDYDEVTPESIRILKNRWPARWTRLERPA